MSFSSDPAPYLIAGGFILTAALTFRFGLRGSRWSAVGSSLAAVVWWLAGVAHSLLRDGGNYENSRFAIWAGLGMAVPLILLFYWIGGSLGVGLGLTLRHFTKKRGT